MFPITHEQNKMLQIIQKEMIPDFDAIHGDF
jgi:hypothetical protein